MSIEERLDRLESLDEIRQLAAKYTSKIHAGPQHSNTSTKRDKLDEMYWIVEQEHRKYANVKDMFRENT